MLFVSTTSIGTKGMRSAMLILLLSFVAACSDNKVEDLQLYVDSVKSRVPSSVMPLPEPIIYDSYIYQSDSQRDPFKPSFTENKVAPSEKSSGVGGPDLSRERGHLERFPLDTLRYIGSMQQLDNAWGLIKTPDGEIVRVKIGDRLGQDYGRVTSVSEAEVVLVELIPDGIGGWEQRTVTLALNG